MTLSGGQQLHAEQRTRLSPCPYPHRATVLTRKISLDMRHQEVCIHSAVARPVLSCLNGVSVEQLQPSHGGSFAASEENNNNLRVSRNTIHCCFCMTYLSCLWQKSSPSPWEGGFSATSNHLHAGSQLNIKDLQARQGQPRPTSFCIFTF